MIIFLCFKQISYVFISINIFFSMFLIVLFSFIGSGALIMLNNLDMLLQPLTPLFFAISFNSLSDRFRFYFEQKILFNMSLLLALSCAKFDKVVRQIWYSVFSKTYLCSILLDYLLIYNILLGYSYYQVQYSIKIQYRTL